MCILLWWLFTLVEWLILFKEDNFCKCSITDSPAPTPSQLSWWTIVPNIKLAILVVDIPTSYGMLLSRKFCKDLGGEVRLDFS